MPFTVYLLKGILGVSWLPIIAVCIVMVFEAFFNFWNVSTIRDKYLVANDVINAQQRLRIYKRREKLYTYIAIPIILLWIVWFLFDVYSGKGIPFPSPERLLSGFVAIVIILAVIFYVFSREMEAHRCDSCQVPGLLKKFTKLLLTESFHISGAGDYSMSLVISVIYFSMYLLRAF